MIATAIQLRAERGMAQGSAVQGSTVAELSSESFNREPLNHVRKGYSMRRIAFIRGIVFLASVLCFCGCAQVQVKRLAANDTATEGVRFYAPQPYLLVTIMGDPTIETVSKSSASQFQSQIIWLPKMNEQYVVNVKPGLGTADGSIKLENGWMLSELGSSIDSKGPETMAAISGAIKDASGLLKVTAPGGGTETVLGAGLYRIEFDPTTGYISKFVPVKLQ